MKFGLISGIGLLIDLTIYLILVKKNISVSNSSAVGSICAIFFVYWASSLMLINKLERNKIKFISWIGYQAINIVIFSNIVNFLYLFGMGLTAAKLTTIPISFICNYIFIKKILKE
jgi:putative flippase GtrA